MLAFGFDELGQRRVLPAPGQIGCYSGRVPAGL